MKKVFTMLLAGILVCQNFQTAKANIYSEISRTCSDPQRMSMVLWMPLEIFDAMSEQLPKGAIEELEKILKGHTMIAAADGRISPFGRMVYQSESDVRKDLAVNKDNQTYSPIAAKDTPDELRHLQDIMQQAWTAMMGEMGSNMRLYLFAVELDAASKGEFTVRLGGTSNKEEFFQYETPLRAVVPDTLCPKCRYSVRAAWNYCPKCGNKK